MSGVRFFEASLKGTLIVVFVTHQDEFVSDLHDGVYVSNLSSPTPRITLVV